MKLFNSRLVSIIRKEFLQIVRDPRTLGLVLGIPITQLLLMGYAATNDVRNIPLAVFDQDHGPAARQLLDAYRAADYFSISFSASSEAKMRTLIDAGKARAGLIIPPGFSQAVAGRGSAQVGMILDGSDPNVASTSLAAARLIAGEHSAGVIAERLNRQGLAGTAAGQAPVDVRIQVLYNPDMISSHFMVPGVIGQILFSLTSILTATAIVRERERGTIEQLIVTPIRPWELILGKIIPYVVLAFLNTLEVLALGVFLFGMPIRGSMTLVLLLSALFLLSGLGWGLLASTLANTQQEAMLIVFMTILPGVFLSGFLFPLEAMPKLLQAVSVIFPIRYYMIIIRSLLIKGVDLVPLQDEILALAVIGGTLMVLATIRFRKRLD